MTLVSIVGHAIFQTAGRSGPSTIDRSKRDLRETSFKLTHLAGQTLAPNFFGDRCKLGSGAAPAQFVYVFEQRRVSLQDREFFAKQRELPVLFSENAWRKLFNWPITIDQLRRGLWSTSGNPRITIRRVTNEGEIVRNKLRVHAKLCAHAFRVANRAAAPIYLNNAIVNDALRQILVRCPDTNLLDTFIQ